MQEFDYATPRYLFNALTGRSRYEMEQARMIGYYASLVHASGKLKLKDFGLFPWEKSSVAVFSELDKERFERLKALDF